VKCLMVIALLAGSGLLSGCSPQGLPPGMPPPEYEVRSLPPWPAAAGAAGQAASGAPEASAAPAQAGSPPGVAAAGSSGTVPVPSPAAPGE